jgi:hypothetical protein
MVTPRCTALCSVLLGVFIVWQLWYLVTANLGELFDASPVRDAILIADQRWAEAACQFQGWRQYSPSIAKQSVFLAVEFRGKEPGKGIESRSILEPDDALRFFQTPANARQSFYESSLNWQMWGWNTKTIAAEPERYRRQMAAHLRGCWRSLRAYLQWQLRDYRKTFDPPWEMVARVRIYAMPPADRQPWTWASPEDLPIARWRPDWAPPKGMLPIEMWDPVTGTFVPIAERE